MATNVEGLSVLTFQVHGILIYTT